MQNAIGDIKKQRKGIDLQKHVFLTVILAVPIVQFLVFWLYVNFNSILMAFQYNTGGKTEWGLYNFTLIWKDIISEHSTFLSSLKNTMLFFVGQLFITLPVSSVLCFFFFKKIKGYKFFRFVFYLPSIITASAYVIIVKYILATNGLYGAIVKAFGGNPSSLLGSVDTAFLTIYIYTVFISFGGNIILLGGAMNQIDRSIIEAAKIDGANMWTEYSRIVIPLTWPTLSTLIIFAFAGMFGSSGPILLFLGEGGAAEGLEANTLSFWIFNQVYYTGEYYYPAAIGLILTAVGFPIAMLVKKLLTKGVDEEGV